MVALNAPALTINLVAMSADAIIQDTARHRAVRLDYGDDVRIRPEHKKDWIAAKRRASNYAKHADRDADQPYDGPALQQLERLNDIQTLFNIIGLHALGEPRLDHHREAAVAIGLLYPEYLKMEELLAEHPELRAMRQDLGPVDRPLYRSGVALSLAKRGLFPPLNSGALWEWTSGAKSTLAVR